MPTYTSFLPTFLPCLFIFLAFGSVIAHPSVLKPFFLPAIPEEVSRKHGSRIRRIARPDVSQQTSRNKRLATNVSQGQRSRDRRFARTGVPTSLFSSYFSSMLVRLSTLWFGFCLLWSFNLSFYKLPEEVSRKHGSRNRRLARTDVCNDARPDVSQEMSRKDRRTYFLLFLCLFIFLALGSVSVAPFVL